MSKKEAEENEKVPLEEPKYSSDLSLFFWKAAGITAIVALIILLLLFVGFAFKVFLYVLSGILLAAFFRGIARWMHQKTGLGLAWSLGLTVLLVIAVITVANILLAPKIADQAARISQMLPASVENARHYLNNHWWGQKLINEIPDNPQKFIMNHSAWAARTFGLVSSTFGVLADLYIILLIGIFMMVNPGVYVNGLVRLVPISKQGRARQVIKQVYTVLQRWLTGKLLSMLIVAVLTFIGLLILGVPLPLTLALIAGLLAFIPNFGPIISLIPAVLIGFLQGPATALYVIILYMVVQVIESNLITPFIQREMVYLPLAMIIIAQVVLGMLVGGLGLILATPIVAVLMVLVKMLYVEDVLGQKVMSNN